MRRLAVLSLLPLLTPAVPLVAQTAAVPAATAIPATACAVRFKVLIDDPKAMAYSGGGGEVLSPVYVLAAKDCPAPGFGLDEYGVEWDAGSVTARWGLTPGPGKTPKHEAGKKMALAFGTWARGRKLNPDAALMRTTAIMVVMPATPFNRERLAKDVGARTYFVEKPGPGGTKQIVAANEKWKPIWGLCLDYAPAGVTPLEVLGKEGCTAWLR